jgi:hypothetical protein
MQFLAYVTHDEIEQHAPVFDVPISRIAQIFAADIMPQQSKNYDAKCATSYVDADRAVLASRAASSGTRLLIPRPLSTSSTYTFQGYRPACLEAFLLQPIYNNVVAPHANAAPQADTAPSTNQGDFRHKAFPLPSVVDREILRISKRRTCEPSSKAALTCAPALSNSELGNQTHDAMCCTKKLSEREGAREGSEHRAGTGSRVSVQTAEAKQPESLMSA